MRRLVVALLLNISASATLQSAGRLDVAIGRNTDLLPVREVLELEFRHSGRYEDPFLDVTLDVVFVAPSGRRLAVGGFHYGSDEAPTIRVTQRGQGGNPKWVEYDRERADTWKARFAPNEVGAWRYSWVFGNRDGDETRGEGSFECVEGRVARRGFVRRHPTNPFRWVFEDGSPYFPIGLQDCWGDGHAVGSVLAGVSMEGPFRTDRTELVELPDGPLYVRGPSMNPMNGDVYFRRMSRAGFDLFRFSPENCSYPLNHDLDRYLVQQGIMTDELLQTARKYDFRIMYGIFGYQKVFNEDAGNADGMAKVKRFVKYSVDRWGAYVDFWQFLNEQNASDEWYAQMVPYLRSIDPYGHPITTSWERPQLEGIEINAPHWYGNENEHASDRITADRARGWKEHGKPVIVGEQGNYVDPKKPRPPGIGGVWDAGSARRMRIRNWTALFTEIAVIFWDTSYARDGHFMNIWLGPREREYVRAMQDFAYRLDADVRPAPVEVSQCDAVRAYGLASETRAAVYMHHFANHDEPVRGVTVTVDVPAAATAYWYRPTDAAVLGRADVAAGRQTLEAPPFVVDLALLITPDGPPDIDGDGIANDLDDDDDADGVPDAEDAFPLEPEEWADADGDLIGDNLDADVDGDGRGDDRNGNAVPDHEEMDLDGDGVPKSKAVPWDAFPLDPREWRDTDGDGVGDNADEDDDGDGWPDAEEQAAGTDPLAPLSFPRT